MIYNIICGWSRQEKTWYGCSRDIPRFYIERDSFKELVHDSYWLAEELLRISHLPSTDMELSFLGGPGQSAETRHGGKGNAIPADPYQYFLAGIRDTAGPDEELFIAEDQDYRRKQNRTTNRRPKPQIESGLFNT